MNLSIFYFCWNRNVTCWIIVGFFENFAPKNASYGFGKGSEDLRILGRRGELWNIKRGVFERKKKKKVYQSHARFGAVKAFGQGWKWKTREIIRAAELFTALIGAFFRSGEENYHYPGPGTLLDRQCSTLPPWCLLACHVCRLFGSCKFRRGESTQRASLFDFCVGATFMAAGSSAPELFTALIGAFFRSGDDNPGPGTIVGSAVFNITVIIGVTAALASTSRCMCIAHHVVVSIFIFSPSRHSMYVARPQWSHCNKNVVDYVWTRFFFWIPFTWWRKNVHLILMGARSHVFVLWLIVLQRLTGFARV